MICRLVMCDLQHFLFTIHKLSIITFCCCRFSKYFIHIMQVNNVWFYSNLVKICVKQSVGGGREKPDMRTLTAHVCK